jgi:hypothetical protein
LSSKCLIGKRQCAPNPTFNNARKSLCGVKIFPLKALT